MGSPKAFNDRVASDYSRENFADQKNGTRIS